jgi:hypothetical protein
LSDVVIVRAHVTFDLRQAAMNSWLAGLSREVSGKRPALFVDTLSIRGAPVPTVDVELIALALKSPDAGSPVVSK